MERKAYLENEAATVAWGQKLGEALKRSGGIVYLEGTLGAGKTTFCRGVLSVFGHSGAVKSPTYTLVEPYNFNDVTVYHFDLYRLADPQELEFIGIRDYFLSKSVALIEWPARGAGVIPNADIGIQLNPEQEGRKLTLESFSTRGVDVLTAIEE